MELDKGQLMSKVTIAKLAGIIDADLCKHYDDDECERCYTECPYDAVKSVLAKLRRENTESTNSGSQHSW